MSPRGATHLAWSLWFLAIAFSGAYLFLVYVNRSGVGGWLVVASIATITVAYPTVGLLIAARRPKNSIGWLFCVIGLAFALYGFTAEYAIYGAVTRAGSVPAVAVMAVLQGVMPQFFFATFSLLLLLFPTGRPPTPRWWPVAWLTLLSSALGTIATALRPGQLIATSRGGGHPVYLHISNPTAVQGITAFLDGLQQVVFLGVLMSFLLASIALVGRLVRTRGDERQQIKWFAYLGTLFVVTILALAVSALLPPIHWLEGWINFVLVVELALGIPAAAGIGILRYRLYDIDAVINKSVVFGALALFITAVYVAVVVGLGALIGTGGRPNLALSILATALLAVAFEPVRGRLQTVANRLVYGERATPYEVLARFSDRVAGTYSSEEVLPRLAQVLAEGTGATQASVWVRVGSELQPGAFWPNGGPDASAGLTERVVPVHHQGEHLGELRVGKRPGEPLSPVEEKLLSDLASQAGLVLRNVRLTAELRRRLDEISQQATELRASRQRIVAAQDAERRRLERNIHDGAQQNLVALTVKLRLAANLARRDPERARESVKALEAETDQALQMLRMLARGIYPPLLREQGLVAAIRADAEKMPLPVTVAAAHLDRYAPEVEAAVYFVCLEALQNVTKHARASRVQIHLRPDKGALSFEVTDDGSGFAVTRTGDGSGVRNMTDRIEAMGGRLEIRSAPHRGTTVSGQVPVRAMEPVS